MTDGASMLYQASIMTVALFTALTAVAFMSNRDFSFLKNILVIGGFLALGAIVAGAIFGFQLGFVVFCSHGFDCFLQYLIPDTKS
jgi:FtsH-binding integral membrane protein